MRARPEVEKCDMAGQSNGEAVERASYDLHAMSEDVSESQDLVVFRSYIFGCQVRLIQHTTWRVLK